MAAIYDYTVKDRKGNDVSMKDFEGKVLLIVNTATGCGFTPQYEGLENLYQKYREQGFEILDFPCNQFGNQAPGNDEEIHEFCTLRYHTTFPRMKKIDVNGANEDPLYTYLKKQKGGMLGSNTIQQGSIKHQMRHLRKEFCEHSIHVRLHDEVIIERSHFTFLDDLFTTIFLQVILCLLGDNICRKVTLMVTLQLTLQVYRQESLMGEDL